VLCDTLYVGNRGGWVLFAGELSSLYALQIDQVYGSRVWRRWQGLEVLRGSRYGGIETGKSGGSLRVWWHGAIEVWRSECLECRCKRGAT
jgi:hypothetical protein